MEKLAPIYRVLANGREVTWTFSRKEAVRIAEQFEFECMTQDVDPFQPEMEIVED